MPPNVKSGFVDLQTIKAKFYNKEMERRIGRGKGRLLSGFGAYTRRAARSSMKKAPANARSKYGSTATYKRGRRQGQQYHRKGKYSPPGKPPFWRSPEPNLRTILFGIEDENTVIVGPIFLRSARKQSRPAPNVHEFGGRVTRQIKPRRGGRVSSQGYRSATRSKTMVYPERKTMKPAGKKGVSDLRRKAKGFIK